MSPPPPVSIEVKPWRVLLVGCVPRARTLEAETVNSSSSQTMSNHIIKTRGWVADNFATKGSAGFDDARGC